MKIINATMYNDSFNYSLIISYQVMYKKRFPGFVKQVIIERSKQTDYKIKKTSLIIKKPNIYM